MGTQWSWHYKPYSHLFDFITAYQKMNTLLARKDDKGLWNFVASCDFVLVRGKEGSLNASMLKKLSKVKGLGVYFDFLLKMTKSIELCASKDNKEDHLNLLRNLVYETTNYIGSIADFENETNGHLFMELKR